jgi:hypothetical protein
MLSSPCEISRVSADVRGGDREHSFRLAVVRGAGRQTPADCLPALLGVPPDALHEPGLAVPLDLNFLQSRLQSAQVQ